METPAPDHPFAHKTDAELFHLARQVSRYPEVGAAAVQELQRRHLIPAELPGQEAGPPPAAAAEPESSTLRQMGRLLQAVFRPRRGYFVTPLLLLANLLLYGAMGVLGGVNLLAPAGADLIAWGSNFSGLVQAQPWRLLSGTFLHGGPAHLFLNLSALLLLGLMAEAKAGSGRWLLVYLLSGVGGSVASLWWHTQGVNSVGASGAIFGLYGLVLALLLTRRAALSRQERAGLLGLLLYFALSSLVGGLAGPAGTDNAAHLGGLATGLAAGTLATLVSRPRP